MNINAYLLIPIIETVSCVVLLALLFTKGKRHTARKPFTLFLLAMGSWGFFIFLMRSSVSLIDALFWEKFVFIAILSAAMLFHEFITKLTGNEPKKYVTYLLHFSYLICLSLIPTTLIVSGMQIMWYGKAPIIGPLFPLYVLCVYIPIVLGLISLIQHGRKTKVLDERIRNQYIIAGIVAMFIGGTTDYLPPIGVNMYPLGIIGNILFCLLATVAMLRYNLLATKVFLRKSIVYLLTSSFLLTIIIGLILILADVFQEDLRPISLTITIVAVFIAATMLTVFQPIIPKFQHVVDRWFFRQRYDSLQALKRFTTETKDITDLKQLTSSLVTAVVNGMQSQAAYLLLQDPETNRFTVSSYYGTKLVMHPSLSADCIYALLSRYQGSIVDMAEMDSIVTANILSEDDLLTLSENRIELIVPLMAEGNLIGLLLIRSKLANVPYSFEDRQLLKRVSKEVAHSIRNALSYENIQKEHVELQEAVEGIIHAMSLVIETRDPYTAGHQKRVANLAVQIAQEMGLPEWRIKGLHVAGLVHDVGKLAVPAEILSKPGKLNVSEFNIIRDHPRVGHDIFEKIHFKWPIAQIILQHHERLDGSGYPLGISGDDIILEARILGVADVLEAMSSHRPYRPALGIDKAIEEITQNKDILFDVDVVNACMRLFKEQRMATSELMTGVSAG